MKMKMGYLHAIAALAMAGYFFGVVQAGNGAALYEAIAEDSEGFLRWGLAAALLFWAVGRLGGPLASSLTTALVVAAAIKIGPTVIKGVESIVTPVKAVGNLQKR